MLWVERDCFDKAFLNNSEDSKDNHGSFISSLSGTEATRGFVNYILAQVCSKLATYLGWYTLPSRSKRTEH